MGCCLLWTVTYQWLYLEFFSEGSGALSCWLNVCIFTDIQANDPEWYQVLTANLTSEQQKALQEVMVLADQRKAAAESKRIEQSGGK